MGDDRHSCHSAKVSAPNGVSIQQHCAGCYLRDHEPVQKEPTPGEKDWSCLHFGPRLRDESGAVLKILCGPCGGKPLDVIQCHHPEAGPETNLAKCSTCTKRVPKT